MIATSVGCLYPAGTITAFDARRGKWRIAVTFDVLRPPPLPVPPRTLTPMTPTAAGFITALTPAAAMATPRSGFGGYFGQAVTHQSVAETDAPPQGVQQVDIATFAVAVGEPAPGGATSVTPPASTSTEPVPTTVEPPRVDVGPTTVPPSSSPPFVPPKVPGSQFPGSQFPATTSARPGEERDNFFRVNNPVMWFAIVGAVAAVGGGGYWLMRRRRRAA
jgi:LPXTG-motif cell wall-anchored protein